MRLNPEQLVVVDSEAPRLCVMASPGSGKTATLIARISRLVKTGVSPYQICALTFTNKAALELEARLDEAIGSDAGRLTAGTFHGFCYGIIQSWATKAGWWPGLSVYDDHLRKDLIDNCIHKLGLRLPKNQIWKHFDRFGATGEMPEEKDYSLLFKEYMATLRRNNALDYNMILTEAWKLLKEPEIATYYRDRYRHILVDEAQDTSELQHTILSHIMPENLFLCGDIDQSIYEWRGASPQLMLDFSEKSETLSLERCYRCPIPVARAANRLIEHNQKRYNKRIISKIRGPEITLWDFRFDGEMNTAIAKYIEMQVVSKKALPKDFFIIARTNRLIKRFAWDLREVTKLPFQLLDRRSDLFSQPVVQGLVYMMQVATNPKNDYAAEQCLKKLCFLPGKEVQELKIQTLKNNEDMADHPSLEFLKKFGPKDDGFSMIYDNADTISANLAENQRAALWDFLQYLWDWRAQKGARDIESFLSFYWHRHAQDDLNLDEDSLKLMTIHACKGLEARIVFVIGATQGVFPSKRSELEEERRLFYVAMTRAGEELNIAWSGQQSQFIKESLWAEG